MNLQSALATYLASKSAVTALVGTRIYKLRRPQGSALPAITLAKVGHDGNSHQAGASSAATARVQVSCWGSTQANAQLVRDAVHGALAGYPGGTWSGITILRAEFIDDYDQSEELDDAADTAEYHVVADFAISYRETIPTFA